MIAFLAPLYLFAAAVAAVPLLVHLLRRRTGARVEFPAVRYLARAEREHSRRLRLRNLLVMLIRVATVLLIALAAARPVIRFAGGAHAPTAMAVVLDNSLSTSAVSLGRPVLSELADQARAIVRRATSDDRLWLVTADGVVRGGSASAIDAAIAGTTALSGAGHPEGALARAAGLVGASPLLGHEVALLTDGQATTWRHVTSLGNARVVAYRPAASPPANHGVTEALAVPARWTPAGTVHGRIDGPDPAAYRITLEGRTLARGTALPGEEVTVASAPGERGWAAGTVEIDPDELRGDDVRHFAVWIGPAPSVHADSSAGPFVSSALAALGQAGRVTTGAGESIAAAEHLQSLPAVIVAPGDPASTGAANRALTRAGVPWQFGAPRRGPVPVQGTGRMTTSLAGVTASLRYALHPAAGASADTLATAGGEPWIVAGPGYVLAASPMSPAATTLPVRAAFVPWLGEMLTQQLGRVAGSITRTAPGAPVARPAGAEMLGTGSGADARIPIAGDTLTAPERPGVYWFLRGGSRVGALVVNAEPRESALQRLSPAALATRLRARSVRVVDGAAVLRAAVFTATPRRPLAVPLLVLALAMVAAETVAARAGAARGGR